MEYIRIATIEDEFEAQILASILAERQIKHYLKSFHDSAYDGLFQKNYGWGALFAPKDNEQEILEIIEDIRKSV
ncbi:conserved hypothetical protein [uncultured Sporomusa sp.]|uniref:DUF2007 domain-containing protein n=1 Tax=uncultured Sporomusa sp. TaxID=307249 RepID=A0A212LZG0_9FIRM|nr:hypothetical protein [uncultured Sporomusa sp.]SCM82913.1 conserved hypothetical protein [uncultured Sporomusa sp.]